MCEYIVDKEVKKLGGRRDFLILNIKTTWRMMMGQFHAYCAYFHQVWLHGRNLRVILK